MMMSAARLRSLTLADEMTPQLRACVHEFGAQIVQSFLNRGIRDPGAIRQLTHSCWLGAREAKQRQGLRASGSRVIAQLDWLLEQNGSQLTAATLLRVLAESGMVIVPRDPGGVMIAASMRTVADHSQVMTKEEKHRRRLRAAIDAAARRLWPQIFDGANAA